MAVYYQIRSPLSQTSDEQMDKYIASVSAALGEKLEKVSLDRYLSEDFALLYVASGGSEGYFLEIFEQIKHRHCYILTSGETNSLAASMEILSFLNKHGGSGEILHGDIQQLAEKLRALIHAHRALAHLKGKNIGCIGESSDWLIASNYSEKVMMDKLGLGFVHVTIEELLQEYEKHEYPVSEYTKRFESKEWDKAELDKALWIYGAMERLVAKYNLCGVTLRCFDLLDTVKTTGCVALSILNSKGIPAGCEGDVPGLLSMVILGAITDEPLFMCNANRFNTNDGTAIFAHCTIPTEMLDSFCLNTHFESGIGVAVQGTFGEGDCTIFKCEGDLSRYHAQEGTYTAFPFSDQLCRTQITVKLDDFDYFLRRPINNHHILCRGKHAAEVEAFFKLIED